MVVIQEEKEEEEEEEQGQEEHVQRSVFQKCRMDWDLVRETDMAGTTFWITLLCYPGLVRPHP